MVNPLSFCQEICLFHLHSIRIYELGMESRLAAMFFSSLEMSFHGPLIFLLLSLV